MTSTTGRRPDRLLHFDGMRGIAALVVALFHFSSTSFIDTLPIVRNGWLFVDMFFVLSGFILDRVYFLRNASFGMYIKTRVARMLPLYFMVFAIFFVFEFGLALRRNDLDGLAWASIVNIFALQSFGLLDRLWFYGPSWTISAELWINALIFPLVMATFWRRGLIAMTAILAVAFVTVLDIHTSHAYGGVRCLYGIGLGVLASRLLVARPDAPGGVSWSLVADLFVTGVLILGFTDHGLQGALPLAFAIMVVLLHWGDRSMFRRVFASPPMVFLGRVSFALYMTHYLVGGRVMRGVGALLARRGAPVATFTDQSEWNGMQLGTGEVTGFAFVCLYVALCLYVAHLVNRHVEEPIYAYFKKRIGAPAAADAVPAL